MTQRWDLRDQHGRVVVADLVGDADELEVACRAANTKHPEGAPHHATAQEGEERVETDETMNEDVIDAAAERAERRR